MTYFECHVMNTSDSLHETYRSSSAIRPRNLSITHKFFANFDSDVDVG
jgi:hypothetical protein